MYVGLYLMIAWKIILDVWSC